MRIIKKITTCSLLASSLTLSVLYAVVPPVRGSAGYWKTNKSGTVFVEKQEDLSFGASAGTADITITPDPSQVEQEIDGFGGSLTHAAAYLINTHPNRAGIIQELFDRDHTRGIGANFVRIPIGASDYALTTATAYSPAGPFSAQDSATRPVGISPFADLNAPDLMTNPAYAIDKDIIEVLQVSLTHNPDIRYIAVPWSAPVRWKTGSASFVGGTLDPQYEEEYADYFADFVQFYAGHGINLWAISIQNEPYHDGNTPSMYMEPAQAVRMAIEFDKEFTARGLDTQIIAFEHNMEDEDYPRQFFTGLQASPEGQKALSRVAGTGWHIYDEDQDGDQEIERMGNFQDELRNTIGISGKKAWITERTGSNPINFTGDAWWFWETITYPSMTNEASGILWWNFMLDHEGKPNLVDGDIYRSRGMYQLNGDNSIAYTAEASIIGHFSKFVEPGARRLTTPGPQDSIYQFVFENPDGTIVVVLRSHNWWSSKNVEVSMHSKSIEVTLEPENFTTLIFKQPGYAGWITQPSFGLSGTDLDRNADPDKDGMSNFLEYALDAHPMTSNTNRAGGISLDRGSGFTDVSFHVGQDTTFVNYVLQKSTNLEMWNTLPFTGGLVTGSDYTRRVDDSEMEDGKLFLRLQVSGL